MTAVGFGLIVIGLLWRWTIQTHPWRHLGQARRLRIEPTWQEVASALLVLAGTILAAIGIAIWLWRVMP